MSEVYPSGIYGDPSNNVDALRRLERLVSDTCRGCESYGGTYWGVETCSINKKRNKDGYCRFMSKGR